MSKRYGANDIEGGILGFGRGGINYTRSKRRAVVDAEKAKREERAKKCEALVTDPVFREWFTKIMLDHGGIEFDRAMTDVAQGQYLMLAKLRDSLRSAPSAPEFFGEIMQRHYELLNAASDKA